ncbi:hypothetical protein BJY01DRAFT_263329 [Aspergillus pseudoustus]|uniref:EGF-like domain-containing protein n=1 Tax=Aspergillus pseudoustus TaxID=1810923 RepID=A0ABR4K1Z6_9EURO
MRLVKLLSVLSIALSQVQACRTDEDCSLNGICVHTTRHGKQSACKCDTGWFGDDCARLDLAPATRWTGYNHTNATQPDDWKANGNSSWGGTIIQDPEDRGLFHLFASQFEHGCGLSGWRPHSFVIRAESRTGPQGPYVYADRVTDAFHHNPQVIFSPADDKYLLYMIGVDAPEYTECRSFSYKQWPNNISVASADSPQGPWTAPQLVLSSAPPDAPHSTNPSPWPLWSPRNPTHEIALGVEDIAIFSAPRWDGEYTLTHTQTWNTTEYSPTWTEDSFLWRDKRGHWHALAHWMIDLVEHDGQKYPRVGAHMFARQLTGPWHFHLHEAFNSSVAFTDGSTQVFKRRERAKLFFSDDGLLTPLYLVTGVQDMGETGRSYTLVQPVGARWRGFEEGLGL